MPKKSTVAFVAGNVLACLGLLPSAGWGRPQAAPPAQRPPAPSPAAQAPAGRDTSQTKAASPASTPALTASAAREKSWQVLNEGLAEKDYDRRAEALAALGTIGPQDQAVKLVEASLDDKSPVVRQAAIEALGTMKARSSIPKLETLLDDHSALISFAAAKALSAMNDRTGRDIFEEVLDGDRKVSSGVLQEGLQMAHQELHDPPSLAELGAEQAAGTLFGPAGFGVEVGVEVAKDKAAPARVESARMLGDDPSPEARAALAHGLDDKSWLVRAAAAQAMGLHGTPKDVPALVPLLSDGQKQVRYRVAAAIIRVTNGLPNG